MVRKTKSKTAAGLYVREEGLSKLSAAERKAMEAYAADYMGFLGKAKTERLAYRASVALLEKNGFQLNGTMTGSIVKNGSLLDVKVYIK